MSAFSSTAAAQEARASVVDGVDRLVLGAVERAEGGQLTASVAVALPVGPTIVDVPSLERSRAATRVQELVHLVPVGSVGATTLLTVHVVVRGGA